MTFDELLASITETADLPLERARTLPAQAYTDPALFAWETGHVFRHEWLALAHVSQIPEPGDFVAVNLLGEPVVAVHGKDGEMRVLSRVCPHRGMDIMPDGTGSQRLLLCPYHSWTFDLDGRLKGCPEMGRAEGFCRDDVGLAEFRSEVWNGFVFVNLDGEAPRTISEQYATFSDSIAPWKLAEMKVVIEQSWDCPFNWKVMVENFMESYHHAGAHAKTLQQVMPARDTWTEEERPHHIRCHLPYKERYRARPGDGDAFPPIPDLPTDLAFEWHLYLGYPTFMFVTAPDCAVWYRLQPEAPDRCRLLTTVLVHPSATELPDYDQHLTSLTKAATDFHLEDMEMCAAVQRGLESGSARPGRLSHLEMPVWLIARYLAARTRGSWPTFDRLAAASQR